MLEKREYTGHMMSKENGSLSMVGFSVDFIPTALNDQEVYEVKKENDHYCYMTPAMVDKIFELIPGNKNNRYVDQFSFDLDNKTSNFVKLKNKLLLDLPENVDANSFASMRFSFVQYTEDVKKEPVILKVQRQYRLDVPDKEGGAIELIFPDNKLECNNFKIYNQKQFDQILEINAKNGKMDAVYVDNLAPINIGSKEVHLSVDFEDEGGILFVQYGSIPTFSCKKVHIFNTIIEGDCTLETKYGNRNKAIPITIENSSLSRGYFSFVKNDDKPISIINSEIAYNVDAINLDLIEASVIKGPVRFNGVREIKDTMIDQVNFEDSKINKIEGGSYVSNGKTIEGSDYLLDGKNTKTGKVTEELELL